MGVNVTFHSDTKIIEVTKAPVGGTVDIDVKIDIYSDGKEDWLADTTLNRFLFPVRAIGGNPLPGSRSLGSTFFLDYGWKIRPYEATHTMQVNGNMYADDGSNPYVPTIGAYNVQIVQLVSSLVDSTVQQLGEIEYASFGGAVHVDVDNGAAGTAFPIGTPQSPVDNMTDAQTIAADRGFNTYHIDAPITLGAETNVTDGTFLGKNANITSITVNPAAVVTNCTFQDWHILGTLDGGSLIERCIITDLNYVNGIIFRTMLNAGTIYLDGGNTGHLLDCYSGVPGLGTPTIDCGGSGQPLAIRGYNGGIKITNKTGTDDISVDFNSGQIKLTNTVTKGTIVLRGVGTLTEDFSSGANVVNQLVNNPAIADAVWGDSLGIQTTLDAELARKFNTNRSVINATNNTLTIYDDDGTTPIKVFDLKDNAGAPSVDEIYERAPQ